MKTKSTMLTVVLLVGACSLIGTLCNAQESTNNPPAPPPTIQGIGTTVSGWLKNQNTNFSYQDLLVWDGPVYQDNVNVANELGASLDLWRQKKGANKESTLFAGIESRTRQAGVAGAFVSAGVGPEFGWMKYDVRIGAFGNLVYRFNRDSGDPGQKRLSTFAGEFGIFADKMITDNSAIGFFVSGQTGQKSPLIGGKLSVTFGNGKGFLGLF